MGRSLNLSFVDQISNKSNYSRMKIIFLLVSFLSIQSFGYELVCPREIKSDQTLSGSAPDGWESFDYHPQFSHKLQGIGVFSGHPKGDAALVPDNEKEPYFWTISKDEKEGYWISCRYGDSRLNLIKKIPDGVSKCVYKYKEKSKFGDYLDCK